VVRPLDRHIDTQELNALVACSSETGSEAHGISPDAVREAERHVKSCSECR